MFDGLTNYLQGLDSSVGVWQAIVTIGFSLIASIAAYLMYERFYGSRHIGAGVHRVFILGGPAVTALLLGIRASIPLGLGTLGALSFVRFRTPVKDPAEIGFLLLLLASSIGAATDNYLMTTMLFVVVFVSLSVQRLAHDRFAPSGRGNVVISLDKPSFPRLQEELSGFLDQKLRGVALESMSVLDGRVSLHYQYQRQAGFNWPAFTNDLNQLAGDGKVEIFVG
jgi:hypothetical protein